MSERSGGEREKKEKTIIDQGSGETCFNQHAHSSVAYVGLSSLSEIYAW